VYLEGLLDRPENIPFKIVGAVDPEPERCSYLRKLKALKVPLFRSLDAFYEKHEAELAVISSPIHFHCGQTCRALEAGSHVLCEKPAAATVEEVDRMIEARDRADRFVSIGFQWSFSETVQALKREILSGTYGKARRLKSLCMWPRNEQYYKRNDWAGRVKDGKGNWILDSPMNNAMAHDLHNMLYLLGEEVERSAKPKEVTAELYRANPIENFDTAAARIVTDRDAEILFLGSHTIPESMGPVFTYEFEKAVVVYPGGDAEVEVRMEDGSIKRYPPPKATSQVRKLWMSIEAVHKGGPMFCGLEASRALTVCVNGARESHPVSVVPGEWIRTQGSADNPLTWVQGMSEALAECYDRACFPSDLEVPWAVRGHAVRLDAR
jgi:predicted dehydrogenase